MRLGGCIDKASQALPAWLHSANCGVTQFQKTRWWTSCWNWWVIDVTQPGQLLRVEGEKEFVREAGLVALYRPRLRFEEWQEAGKSAHESWILFSSTGEMRDTLHALTAPAAVCYFEDSEQQVARKLQTISEQLFYRKAGFQWFAQATLIELLALITTSEPRGHALRALRPRGLPNTRTGLVRDVEEFIRSRIGEPLQVADLARHSGLGLSAFAHQYRALAGESPYRTIIRLKMEAAKRMLVDDRISVKETAGRLGFSSEFHFSRCFKRLEGLPPSTHMRAMNAKM